jgi:hypothetical protein
MHALFYFIFLKKYEARFLVSFAGEVLHETATLRDRTLPQQRRSAP